MNFLLNAIFPPAPQVNVPQPEPEQRQQGGLNWNSIQGHRWPDALYAHAVTYLKDGTIPDGWGEKKKRLFRQRTRVYTLREDKIVLVDHHIPRWLEYDQIPIHAYADELPVVYTVTKESDIRGTLEGYLKDPMLTGFSRDALYDKVVRDRLLGISKKDVDAFLKSTDMFTKLRETFRAPVVKSYRPTHPLQHWQIDLIDMSRADLREKNNSYAWLVVIIDIFSKFVYIYPIVNKEAKSTAAVISRIFLQGDIPKYMQHDDGPEFKREFLKVLGEFNVKNIQNPAYNPKTNGFVENKNKQIKGMLHAYMTSRKTKVYYDVLDRITFNINNTKHTVTNMTPFQVHRGIDVVFNRINNIRPVAGVEPPEDVIDEHDNTIVRTYVESVKKLYDRRVGLVKGVIHRTADKRERIEENTPFNTQLVVGDRVRIGQKQSMNPGKKLIPLRLVRENGSIKKSYADGFVPKTMYFNKKLLATVYPETFTVHSVVHEARKPYYVLVDDSDGERVYAYQFERDNVYTRKIYRSQIYLIRNEQTEFIKRPQQGYPFVDQENPIPLGRANNVNADVDADADVDKDVRLTKKEAAIVLKKLMDDSLIRSLKGDNRVYINYVFVVDDTKTTLNAFRGYLANYYAKGEKVPREKMAKMTEPTWRITFEVSDNKKYFLPLHMSKYEISTQQNGWVFSDPNRIRRQFL